MHFYMPGLQEVCNGRLYRRRPLCSILMLEIRKKTSTRAGRTTPGCRVQCYRMQTDWRKLNLCSPSCDVRCS
jgi:hypothetical protein